jgi:transcriptional regulator with XRE-family HTH domain
LIDSSGWFLVKTARRAKFETYSPAFIRPLWGTVQLDWEESMKIGVKVREARRQLNLTIQDVANATGLSKGFISQVENDKTSPSLSTLNKIAQALDTHLTYLLLDGNQDLVIVSKKDRAKVKRSGAGIQAELLSASGRKLEMMMIEIAPGRKGKLRPRTHSGEECYLVLDGQIQVSQAGETLELEAGDSWHWDASVVHEIRNAGRKTARLVMAVVPQAAHALSF